MMSKMKKSQILLFGSLLILIGVFVLFSGYLKGLREEVYESVRLSMAFQGEDDSKNKVNDAEDVTNLVTNPNDSSSSSLSDSSKNNSNKRGYNYVGYLEIPKIKLKRGFLNKDSKYNDINYNVTVSNQADYPDVVNGNFILIAHSGDAYISFFEYLYKLKIGDFAYVTYGGRKYKYKLVKVEEQPKTGEVAIHRPNYQVNGLTLITCTKNSDTTQSIYIFELV